MPVVGEQKKQHFVSPDRFARDRDLFDILVVLEEKADITPLPASFPAGETLQLNQNPHLAGREDIAGFDLAQKRLELFPGQ